MCFPNVSVVHLLVFTKYKWTLRPIAQSSASLTRQVGLPKKPLMEVAFGASGTTIILMSRLVLPKYCYLSPPMIKLPVTKHTEKKNGALWDPYAQDRLSLFSNRCWSQGVQ